MHGKQIQIFFLVSDAIQAFGEPSGLYQLGTMSLEISHNRAYLAGTPTLAGNLLGIDEAVRFFRSSTNCSIVKAIEAATLKPAEVLGI